MPFYPVSSSGEGGVQVTVVRADRRSCPVCGDPTGDCKGESAYHGAISFIPAKPNDPRATFRVQRRIYEEVEVNGRMQRKLVYAKGAAITPEEARRLGLMAK